MANQKLDFTFTNPLNGQEVVVTGTNPPDEKTLNTIFAQHAAAFPADQKTLPQMALETAKHTMGADIPGLGKVAKGLREDIPGAIAESSFGQVMPKTAAAIGTGVSLAGEMVPKTGLDAALMGLPAVGKVTGATKVAKEAATGLLGAFTRIESPIIKHAIEQTQKGAKVLSDLGSKQVADPMAVEDAVVKLGSTIKASRKQLGDQFGQVLDGIIRKVTKPVKIADIGQSAGEEFAKKGYLVEGIAPGDISKELQPEIKKLLHDLTNVEISFEDAHNLKTFIGDLIKNPEQKKLLGVTTNQNRVLSNAYDALNTRLRKAEPRYAFANDKFARAAEAMGKLSDDLLSGKPETVARRIQAVFQKGTHERKLVEQVDKISAEAGDQLNNLLNVVTKNKFAPIVNPKIPQAALHTGGGAAAAASYLGHPGALGVLAGVTAASSPRLASLGIRAFNAPVVRGSLPGLGAGAIGSLLALQRNKGAQQSLIGGLNPVAEKMLRSREQK